MICSASRVSVLPLLAIALAAITLVTTTPCNGQEPSLLSLPSLKTEGRSLANASQTELIQQRYPSGKLFVERRVTQDAQGNYVNHGDYQQWSEAGDLLVTGSYQMGQQHGVWVRFCDAGQSKLFEKSPYRSFKPPFQSTVEFSDGRMNGVWTITDQEGRTVSQIQFADGRREGPAIWFHPNGSILWQSEYQDGLLTGSFLENDANGKLSRSEQYRNGRRIDTKRHYFANKQVKAEIEYLSPQQKLIQADDWNRTELAVYEVSGSTVRHGQTTEFHENGTVKSTANYNLGKREGAYEAWYPNGQREVMGAFRSGHQEGDWSWWHPNGMRKISVAYQDGAISGEVLAWNDAGSRIQSQGLIENEFKTELAHSPSPNTTKIQPVGTGGRKPKIQ
jgi:uncharacterized protein